MIDNELAVYSSLLLDIQSRIRQGQVQASISANAEMLATYWDIGKMIHERQLLEGWGKGVIPRLAKDLKNQLSDAKGFSERNINYMMMFYREYSDFTILQLPVAKLEGDSISPTSTTELMNKSRTELSASQSDKAKKSILQLPTAALSSLEVQQQLIRLTGWAHHLILMQKIKDLSTRYWYMQQTLSNGWSRDTLASMIISKLHKRQGSVVNNFEYTLPPMQSNLAKQMLKDPYVFDFMTLTTEFTERELEFELVRHIERFLVELGAGFAFVGRQYKLEISEKDFYIDLLFYHLKMRCFVVVELKKGDFIPEYAGKMNFYCSAVDDILKHPNDQPTIGLILCQNKDKLFVEYALRDIHKPIGISEYELTRILPDNLKSSLPSIEEIEAELHHLWKGDS